MQGEALQEGVCAVVVATIFEQLGWQKRSNGHIIELKRDAGLASEDDNLRDRRLHHHTLATERATRLLAAGRSAGCR